MLAVLLLAALALGACYRPDPNVTESGKGRPQLTIDFPERVDPGATEVATLNVRNPGPGDMPSVVVAFSRVGDPQLPEPIVDVGSGGRNEAIVDVSPKPVAISQDAVIYRFEGLPESETMTIRFTLQLPEKRGEFGNAVQVYDGHEPERATGARLSVAVGVTV